MQWPNFTDPQFLDANGVGGLNAAMGTVTGAIAAVGSGAWAAPGLLAPESMTLSFSGMVATVGLPRPWGIVASSGAIVRAHGTQTNQDTTSYAVDFAPLIPGGGSITAYLAASITQIQQNPFPIPGPPQGDSGYNPNFIPTVGYATNLYSVALAAVTGVPNNTGTFELFRTVLTAGQTTLSIVNTVGQTRAANRKAFPGSVLSTGGNLLASQAQNVLVPGSPSLTHTLPPVSGAGGLVFVFNNDTAGDWTIATSGADRMHGFRAANLASFVIPANGCVSLWANALNGSWDVVSFSPGVYPGNMFNSIVFTINGTFTVPDGVTQIFATVVGGGGASGGTAVTGPGQASVGAPGNGAPMGIGIYTVTPGQVIAVTVGTGGGATSGNGAAGGTSSFGSFLSSPGGAGGVGSAAGTPPFARLPSSVTQGPTGANLVVGGERAGQIGMALDSVNVVSGGGGPGPFGGGGSASQGAPVTGGWSGAGASGACNPQNSAAQNGANGADGIVILQW